MKNSIKWAAYSLVAIVFLQACTPDDNKPETGTVTVNFVATANGQPFEPGLGFTSVKGLPYKFDVFKFYVSDLALYTNGVLGDTVLDADLINFSNTIPHKSFTVEVKPGSYSGFQLGVGLDSIQNKYDPTSFPTSSPFSASQGTHWGMFFMYRFMLIDGAIDTTDDNIDSYVLPVIIHTGFDSLYKTKAFTSFPFEVKAGQNTVVNVNFDFNQLFYNSVDTIDLLTNHITHTSDNFPLANKVTKNFVNALQASH